MSAIVARIFCLTVAAVAASCDNAPAPKDKGEWSPLPNVAQVEGLIRASVRHDNGLLSVRDPVLRTLSLLPISVPWAVHCGIGLNVSFGSYGEDAPGVVALTHRFVSAEACAELAPEAARVVQIIMAGC